MSSVDKARGERPALPQFYLLAGFYELVNRHHSVSVPIHLLKKKKNDLTQRSQPEASGLLQT